MVKQNVLDFYSLPMQNVHSTRQDQSPNKAETLKNWSGHKEQAWVLQIETLGFNSILYFVLTPHKQDFTARC